VPLGRASRHDAQGGLSGPFAAYEARDAAAAHVLAVADGLKESHGKLAARFIAEVEKLATAPVGADELDQVRRKMRAGQKEPGRRASMTVGAAINSLIGRAPINLAELERQIDELTPESVREAAAEALDTALFMLPIGQTPDGTRYRNAPDSSLTQVEGRTLRSADFPVNRERLILGADGVTHIRGPQLVTVRFDECEALQTWPDGARVLFGRDGFNLRVEPTLWDDGGMIPALIDREVPASRAVPMPDRPAAQIPKHETSRRQRLRARLKRD
jgi:hypothetical protein